MQRFLDAANSGSPLPNADIHHNARVLEMFRQARDRIGMSDADLIDELMPAIDEGIENLSKLLPKIHQDLRDMFYEHGEGLLCLGGS